MRQNKITIYSLPACGHCTTAKQYLLGKGIHFRDVNVSSDQKAQKEMIEKSGQFSVPVLDINGTIVVGFQKNLIDELLAA